MKTDFHDKDFTLSLVNLKWSLRELKSDIMTILLFSHTQRYHWNVLSGIIVLCSAAEAVDELKA